MMHSPWALLILLIPILAEYYVSHRVWQLLPPILPLRIIVVALMTLAFIFAFVSFSGALDRMPLELGTFTYEVGSSWLILLLYLVMLFGVLDLGLALGLIPRSFVRGSVAGSVSVLLFFIGLFTYAHLRFEEKQRVELTLDSEGKVQKPVKLVLISDLHLGYHNRRSDLRRWLELIKREHPDAVLIAGDLIDWSIKPVLEEGSAEEFRELGIPIYAILGNHDYHAGTGADKDFCEQAGIQLLQDSVAYFGDLAIVGRDDRTNPHRKSLGQIMEGIDRRKYIIELDHQPDHLEEAQQCGVNFEFAGHTHHGQVWPLNWVTDAVYEDAFGPLTKGKTEYYVSSGIGIWGGKFRIGTQSEYVVATIR